MVSDWAPRNSKSLLPRSVGGDSESETDNETEKFDEEGPLATPPSLPDSDLESVTDEQAGSESPSIAQSVRFTDVSRLDHDDDSQEAEFVGPRPRQMSQKVSEIMKLFQWKAEGDCDPMDFLEGTMPAETAALISTPRKR